MLDAATRRKFEALVSAAFIDGVLGTPEREVLRQKAGQMKIPGREMNEIIALGEQRKLSVTVPSGSMEREALLEDLIEVVSADGRVEAPEYHLLARFAETLKISLPDLRARVNRRMQGKAEPRRETVRSSPRQPDPPRPAVPAFEPPKFAADALPPMAPPSMPTSTPVAPQPTSKSMDASFPREVHVGDVPPVTLQLLRQSIMFDNESDSILYISRTLNLPPSAAADMRQRIMAAFPDLKPGSQQLRSIRR